MLYRKSSKATLLKGSVREKLKTKDSDITNKSHLCKYENVVFIIKNPRNWNKCF